MNVNKVLFIPVIFYLLKYF